jgi:hypothetical protein
MIKYQSFDMRMHRGTIDYTRLKPDTFETAPEGNPHDDLE